jgi:hypothetical protein
LLLLLLLFFVICCCFAFVGFVFGSFLLSVSFS